jgi:hypothetical protein
MRRKNKKRGGGHSPAAAAARIDRRGDPGPVPLGAPRTSSGRIPPYRCLETSETPLRRGGKKMKRSPDGVNEIPPGGPPGGGGMTKTTTTKKMKKWKNVVAVVVVFAAAPRASPRPERRARAGMTPRLLHPFLPHLRQGGGSRGSGRQSARALEPLLLCLRHPCFCQPLEHPYRGTAQFVLRRGFEVMGIGLVLRYGGQGLGMLSEYSNESATTSMPPLRDHLHERKVLAIGYLDSVQINRHERVVRSRERVLGLKGRDARCPIHLRVRGRHGHAPVARGDVVIA